MYITREVHKFCKKHSSQCHFDDIKMVNIQASSYVLHLHDFAKFDQNSIQYINTAVWYFNNVSLSMRSLQIHGDDTTVNWIDANKWKTLKFNNLRLSVAYKFVTKNSSPCLADATAKNL